MQPRHRVHSVCLSHDQSRGHEGCSALSEGDLDLVFVRQLDRALPRLAVLREDVERKVPRSSPIEFTSIDVVPGVVRLRRWVLDRQHATKPRMFHSGAVWSYIHLADECLVRLRVNLRLQSLIELELDHGRGRALKDCRACSNRDVNRQRDRRSGDECATSKQSGRASQNLNSAQ